MLFKSQIWVVSFSSEMCATPKAKKKSSARTSRDEGATNFEHFVRALLHALTSVFSSFKVSAEATQQRCQGGTTVVALYMANTQDTVMIQ